jgi:hypothetical protein
VSRDPYEVLGVRPTASKEQLHDAYRRLVKLHHPDRNGGSAESARRFVEVQQAYDAVRERRSPPRSGPPPRKAQTPVEDRMADIERELREAQAARERARQAARDAIRESTGDQSGHVTTEDSFTKILADVRDEVSGRLSGARDHPAVRRVADLIDGIEDLSSRFDKR